jgi:hypothetical protein
MKLSDIEFRAMDSIDDDVSHAKEFYKLSWGLQREDIPLHG